MRDNAEATFAPAPLDHVIGGAWTRPAHQSPDMLKLLDQTNESLKDMIRNQQSSSTEMLPLMMAMMMMRRR